MLTATCTEYHIQRSRNPEKWYYFIYAVRNKVFFAYE